MAKLIIEPLVDARLVIAIKGRVAVHTALRQAEFTDQPKDQFEDGDGRELGSRQGLCVGFLQSGNMPVFVK